MADADLEAAWGAVHDATPPGPPTSSGNNHWEQYAYDPSERPKVGKRSREWTAIARTEMECVREMARCLAEIGEGRWPK